MDPRRRLIAGDKAAEIPQLIPYLERGWNVVNANYRQGPGTAPQAVDDVMCAYRRVIEIVEASGMPTDQVVVSGYSAGGHLALLVGMLNSDGDHPCGMRPPKAVVNWFALQTLRRCRVSERNAAQGELRCSWIGNADKVTEISSQYSPLFL